MNTAHHPKKPCKGCPFARATAAGETGGAHPVVYIGQARAGMWLPCHSAAGYAGKATHITGAQCAGAAIYRANCGIKTQPPLHSLPPDTETVFACAEELLAHHARVSPSTALLVLRTVPEEKLAEAELGKAGVRVHLLKRDVEEK